jgi:hypothetical protein
MLLHFFKPPRQKNLFDQLCGRENSLPAAHFASAFEKISGGFRPVINLADSPRRLV